MRNELRERAAAGADTRDLEPAFQAAVDTIVREQAEAGLTIVNDGEQCKTDWATYVRQRLTGLGGEAVPWPRTREMDEFPDYVALRPWSMRPTCDRPLAWKDLGAVEQDIARLKQATASLPPGRVFMSALSPGTFSNFHPNRYYATEEEYLQAIGEVMRREYEAIANAGFTLQLDCPDLALKAIYFAEASIEEFRRTVAMRVEALNYATRNIPPEAMRAHVCWGRSENVRLYDPPLTRIVDLLLKLRPRGLSIVGCNGRHEHEWKVWQDVKLPDDKVLIPGVIDNTTALIEHPETVAERILRYARIVGPERVVASVNCGFGNNPETTALPDTRLVWAKLRSLAEGARLAGEDLGTPA